jgi:hypothetical protein
MKNVSTNYLGLFDFQDARNFTFICASPSSWCDPVSNLVQHGLNQQLFGLNYRFWLYRQVVLRIRDIYPRSELSIPEFFP